MRKTSVCLLALLSLGMTQVASAASTNPVKPNAALIQGLTDQTPGFSGNAQLSTVNSITNIPTGIEIDATFRVGVGTSDPFDPNYGQNFARISLQGLPFPHLDWSAFDGMQLSITHSTGNAFIQPFVQTGGSFLYHEASGGGFGLGTTAPTPITLDFSNARHFSPFTDPAVVSNTNDVGAWGVQIITNGVAVGQPVNVIVRVETTVPEPATVSMVGLCVAAWGFTRRRLF